jgi:hypothetical protein
MYIFISTSVSKAVVAFSYLLAGVPPAIFNHNYFLPMISRSSQIKTLPKLKEGAHIIVID